MSSPQAEAEIELYCIAETIENAQLMVTASPELWVNGNILLWPPGEVDRSKPTPPQSDWTPTMCRILKSSIATFKEALEFEKMYSKHRNSDSFREFEARKQLKRKHPINENENLKSDLIDMSSLVNKINNENASKPKNVELKAKGNKYHSLCLDKDKAKLSTREPNKNKFGIPPRSNVRVKPKNPALEKGGVVNEVKKPRYENYLKSGKINTASAAGKKKISPPPLIKMNQAKVSSTITKEQYLIENALTENEFNSKAYTIDKSSTPINEEVDLAPLDDQNNVSEDDQVKNIYSALNSGSFEAKKKILNPVRKPKKDEHKHSEFGTGIFGEDVTNPSIKKHSGLNVIEDIVIRPASVTMPPPVGNDQISEIASAIVSGLNDIKNIFKQSEQRRMNYEARMQTQWEVFVKKVSLNQGQNDDVGESLDVNEDFDELDKNFPVKRQPSVEQLDWYIERDLPFKRRMKNRIDLLGGRDEKDSIRRKMKYLIADTALEHYTWRGTADKKPFLKLTFLNDLIFKSVRSQYPKYTLKQYSTYMVEWLKHAKTRQRKVVYQYPNARKEDDEDFHHSDDDGFDPQY